ncbi:PadR family transcriptional regulator [Halomarina litorea]|uniref:PadR family transcriptional regulator n=1 Tax=Halomarina litorea TaxID=2961595 RepID=UPI0020C35ED9|nr:PadR family transcriptional regulator [Halomarina sp. BCD28]
MSGLDEPSGQTIKMALEERTNTDITHGRLYPNLDTLVNDRFIEKGEIDRRTNYYAISEMGVDALAEYADWMTERGNLSD